MKERKNKTHGDSLGFSKILLRFQLELSIDLFKILCRAFGIILISSQYGFQEFPLSASFHLFNFLANIVMPLLGVLNKLFSKT